MSAGTYLWRHIHKTILPKPENDSSNQGVYSTESDKVSLVIEARINNCPANWSAHSSLRCRAAAGTRSPENAGPSSSLPRRFQPPTLLAPKNAMVCDARHRRWTELTVASSASHPLQTLRASLFGPTTVYCYRSRDGRKLFRMQEEDVAAAQVP